MAEGVVQEAHRQPRARAPEGVLELAKADGVKLIDWTTRGTPKPDVLHGTLQVDREATQTVFTRLTDLQHWIRHEWFPIGIVNPEGFIVNFTNHRELGR